MSAEPLVVILIGPGGVGKGTLADLLVEAAPDLWLSHSWTTRAPRTSERGDEYHFVARPVFEAAIAADAFLEWAEFHGYLYGTPVPRAPEGRDVLLEIEVQGAEQVRERYPDALVILIVAPSMDRLEERLRARGDDEAHVRDRLATTPEELERGRALADAVVVNDDLGRASREILSILEARRRHRRDPSYKD